MFIYEVDYWFILKDLIGNKHTWFILGPLSTAEIYHIFFIIQKYACLVCNDPNVLLNWFFVKREIYLHYNLYSKDFIRNIFIDFIIISVKNVLRVSFSDPDLGQAHTLIATDEHDKRQWLHCFQTLVPIIQSEAKSGEGKDKLKALCVDKSKDAKNKQ